MFVVIHVKEGIGVVIDLYIKLGMIIEKTNVFVKNIFVAQTIKLFFIILLLTDVFTF